MLFSVNFSKWVLACLVTVAISPFARAQDGLYKIAESLSSPTFTTIESAMRGLEDEAVMFRQELAYQQLSQLKLNDTRLSGFLENRLDDYRACNLALRALRRLDDNILDFEGVVAKTLAAGPAMYKAGRANLNGEKAVYNDYDQRSVEELVEKALTELFEVGYNAYQKGEALSEYRRNYRAARIGSIPLEVFAREQIKSPPNRNYGIGCVVNFSDDGQTVTVQEALDGSPAKEAGLLPGDILLSVGGERLTRDTFSELMGLSRDAQGDSLELLANRGGTPHSYTLKRTMPLILPVFGVDLDGSFDGFYSSDTVYVENVSGRDLTNVVLFVDINGNHGASAAEESDKHMHYVKDWPAGSTQILRYLSTAVDGIASNESVDQIRNLQFHLYSDQFTQSEEYVYSSDEFTKDVKRYLENLRFTIEWHSYSDSHLLFASGVTLKTVGGARFPATTMEMTVNSGGVSRTAKFNIAEDVFDGDEYFSDKRFNGMDVDSIDISFTLPYTDHTIDLTATFETEDPLDGGWAFDGAWDFDGIDE